MINLKRLAIDTGKEKISKNKEKDQQEVINKLKEEVKELQLKNTDPKISNHIIRQNEINSHMIRAFASLIEDNKLNSKIRRSGFGMFF